MWFLLMFSMFLLQKNGFYLPIVLFGVLNCGFCLCLQSFMQKTDSINYLFGGPEMQLLLMYARFSSKNEFYPPFIFGDLRCCFCL